MRGAPLILLVLLFPLSVLLVAGFPVARACINPPDQCTTPDFQLSMESPGAIASQGSPPLAATNIYGFSNAYYTGNVNLSLTITPNLPNGPTMSLETPILYFIPAVSRGSGVLINAGLNTPLGNYTVIVTGTDGTLTRTTNFTLTVQPPIPPDDFTIALYPNTNTLKPGDQTGITIQVFRKGPPHAVPIDLTVDLNLAITPPGGFIATGFPSSLYIGAYDGIGETFTIQSTTTTHLGTYAFNATGTNYQRSQALSHSATAAINVTSTGPRPPPNPAPNPPSRSNTGQDIIPTILVSWARLWDIVIGILVFLALTIGLVAAAILKERKRTVPASGQAEFSASGRDRFLSAFLGEWM